MKRIITTLLLVAIFMAAELQGFSGGSGTSSDPYLISNSDDLVEVLSSSVNMGKSFRLEADIDMAGVDFTPIGTEKYPFTGIFNGNGKQISNVTISINDFVVSRVGFFGKIGNTGRVQNLKINNFFISAIQGTYIGGLAGHNLGVIASSEVIGCNVIGDVNVGGVAGSNCGQILFCKVLPATTITANSGLGGIAGCNESGASINYCDADVTLDGGDYVGGIAGLQLNSSIDNSNCDVVINGGSYVGGVVGFNSGSLICSSSSTGNINGSLYTGGIVGYNNTGELRTSTTNANVSGGNYVGGIAGCNELGSILTTTSYCNVSGDDNVDRFVGGGDGGVFVPAQEILNPADLNEDGDVDEEDLIIFVADWLSEEEYLAADLSRDGIVNLLDFVILAENWLQNG